VNCGNDQRRWRVEPSTGVLGAHTGTTSSSLLGRSPVALRLTWAAEPEVHVHIPVDQVARVLAAERSRAELHAGYLPSVVVAHEHVGDAVVTV